MASIKTFYGEPELKASLIQKTLQHQEADSYIRGKWLSNEKTSKGFKGCWLGCMTQSDDRTIEKASKQYGLPLWYVSVGENIYENLPENEWLDFPLQSIEVLPVGVDLNAACSMFFKRLLEDQLRFCEKGSKTESAIKQCIELFNVPFDEISLSEAQSAQAAAQSAWLAESAGAAAESAAESAALSAALSAADLASRAASNASNASRAASKENYYSWMRDMLFDSIQSTCAQQQQDVKAAQNIPGFQPDRVSRRECSQLN